MSLPVLSKNSVSRIGLIFSALLFAIGMYAQTQTFNSNGPFVVPANVTSITVEAWGGGGGAGIQSDRCGGGGGGAYARKVIAVSPGQMFNVVVGSGGSLESNGGNSIFGANLVVAEGGRGGNDEDGGNGGAAGNSIGDVRYSGGDGGDGTNNGGGGGGGGSAFTTGNGQDGNDGGSSSGGSGGNGTGDGGRGGDEDGFPNAQPGDAPGGGGGGRGDDAGSSQTGAAGRVVVTWCVTGPVTLPYTADFETAGPVDEFTSDEPSINGVCEWAFDEVQSSGRLRFNQVTAHSGSKAALMDRTSFDSNNDQTNFLILTIDLSNYSCATDLALSFWHAQYGDESHGNDKVWIRGSDSDSWLEIHDLTSSQGSNGQWVQVSGLDIDQLLGNNGQSVSSTFQVRFGQEDNTTYSQDGRAFDDVSITGSAGVSCCTDPVIDMVQATTNPICSGDETMLSVTGTLNNATEWHWYSGSCGGTSVGTGATINVSPNMTTTYFVRGEGGCVTPGDCEEVTITVHLRPTVFNVGGGGEYCAGGTGVPVTLSGSAGSTGYRLQRDGSNVGPTVQGIGIPLDFGNQTTPGTYTVVATNSSGCTAEMNGSAVVSTKPVPECSISDGMGAVCPSSTGNQYSAQAGMDAYQWSITGDGSIPGPKNGQMAEVSAGASGSYTLTVVVTKNGCTSSCSKTVMIETIPFEIVYNTEYCQEDPGPVIGLNGSEMGATYKLQSTGGGITLDSTIIGTGSNLIFGAFPAGAYQILITNGTCNATLTQTINASSVNCRVDVPDHCTCNSPSGYTDVTVKVSAPPFQNWTVVDVIGLYGPSMAHPPITVGTTLNYVGGNMYTLEAARDNTKGYFVRVSNGSTEKDIQVGNPSW